MNYDNSLLPDNMLTYKPFATEQEYITSRAFTQDTDSEYPAAIAELSVGRLMKDKKTGAEYHQYRNGRTTY